MSSSSKLAMVLEMKADMKGVREEIQKVGSSMDTVAKGMAAVIRDVTAQMNGLGQATARVAEMLEALQDKPRAAAVAEDARKAYQYQKMKGVQAAQTDPMKRAAASSTERIGLGGFQDATRIMQDFAALSSTLSSKIKGSGIMRSDQLAAQAMRAMTDVDKQIGSAFFGFDFNKIAAEAGASPKKAQKRATQALVESLQSVQGKAGGETDQLITQALTGYKDPNRFAQNLVDIGGKLWKDIGNKPLDARKIASSLAGKMRVALNSFTDPAEMEKYVAKMKIKMPDASQFDMSSQSGQKKYNDAIRKATYNAAYPRASNYIRQSNRALAENYLSSQVELTRSGGLGPVQAELTPEEMAQFDPPKKQLGLLGQKMEKAFKGVGDFFGKVEKKVEDKLGASGDSMMSGLDALGYRLITVSYMLQKASFAFGNMERVLLNAGQSRLEQVGRIQPILEGGLGESGEELKKYQAQLEDIAASTGREFDSLARSLYDASSAFPFVADKFALVSNTAKMATVGFGNAERNMEGMIAVMKTYNRELEHDQQAFDAATARIGSMSVAAANLGTLELDELASAMQKMAPSASQLGVSLEELYASIATIAGVTGSTDVAATQIKQLMTSMISPTTSAMRELFEEQGVGSGRQLVEKSGGFLGALQLIQQKTGVTGNYKEYTGRVQAQYAAAGILGGGEDSQAQKDYTRALKVMQNSLLELDRATVKATRGQGAAAIAYAASMQEFKTIQAEMGIAMLPFKVMMQELKNKLASLLAVPVAGTFIQVTGILLKFGSAITGVTGALALAVRGITSMSSEMARSKAWSMAKTGAGPDELRQLIERSDIDAKGNTVYSVGVKTGDGFKSLGSSVASGMGKILGVLGKAVAVISILNAVLSVVSFISSKVSEVAKKKADKIYDDSTPLMDSLSESTSKAIHKIETAYTDEQKKEAEVARGGGLTNLQVVSESISATIDKLEKGDGKYTADYVSALPPDMRKSVTDMFGPILQVWQRKALSTMLKDTLGTQVKTMQDALRGARPAKTAEQDAVARTGDIENDIRGIFTKIILDERGAISPFNYQQALSDAAIAMAERASSEMFAGGGDAGEATRAYMATIAQFQKSVKSWIESSSWSEESKGNLRSAGLLGADGKAVYEFTDSAANSIYGVMGTFDEMMETAASAGTAVYRFGAQTSLASSLYSELTGSIEALGKSSKNADRAFINNAESMRKLQEAIDAAAVAARRETLRNQQAQIKASLAGLGGANNPAWMNGADFKEALNQLGSALDPAVFAQALKKASSLSGASGALMTPEAVEAIKGLADSREGIMALASALSDQGDINQAAKVLGQTGLTIGEGADEISAAGLFLANAQSATRETLDGFKIMTPQDGRVFTDLILGFDKFALAGKEIAKALASDKISFLGRGAKEAADLMDAAQELRDKYAPGSPGYNENAVGSGARGLDMELADRYERQAKIAKMANPTNWLQSAAESGDLMKVVSDGFVGLLSGGGIKSFGKKIAQGNDAVQAWGASPKDQYVDGEFPYWKPGAEGDSSKFTMATVVQSMGDALRGIPDKVGAGLGAVKDFFTNKDHGEDGGEKVTGFVDALSKGGDILGAFISILVGAIASSQAVQKAFNAIGVIMEEMMVLLEPVIESILPPLIGIFAIIGQLLGALLVPILQAIGPILETFANLFVTVYNLLLPVFEVLFDIFSFLGAVINNTAIAIMRAISYITLSRDDDYWRNTPYQDVWAAFRVQNLQKINIAQVKAAGAQALANTPGTLANESASEVEATRLPDNNYYFYIGADMITDVSGGKVVSVDFILEEFRRRLAEVAEVEG